MLAAPAFAQEVSVVALFADKAMLAIDKGKPRTLRIGETVSGVTLVSADSESAVISIKGRKQRLKIGEGAYSTATVRTDRATTTLIADRDGHFVVTGTINGASVRFLVDTGATMVSMDVNAARRAGVNYLAGTRGYSQTANGVTPVFKVKLDSVKVGDISLTNVDGLVHESPLPVVLLGMSFLGQLQMRNEGDSLTLTKRY
ncbi:MAG TPA: TIGR02281 family clan AA aspartic protease [Burkholderiales bacterium]